MRIRARIPFLIRGPGIAAGSRFEGLASNVDVMPTLLGLAGGTAQPALWDGRSAAPHFLGATPELQGWRTELLIEYFAGGNVVRYEHLEDALNNSFRLLRRVDNSAPAGEKDLSIAQFVGPDNWNFTAPIATGEAELFDVATDPFQMQNLYGSAAPALRQALEATLSRLFGCAGATCN
jgi:arylsulfatase A-like enzyme